MDGDVEAPVVVNYLVTVPYSTGTRIPLTRGRLEAIRANPDDYRRQVLLDHFLSRCSESIQRAHQQDPYTFEDLTWELEGIRPAAPGVASTV